MAEAVASKDRKKIADLPSFTVEFGNVNNSDFHLSSLQRKKVRGEWSVMNFHRRPKGGRDIGSKMSAMPELPGQRLEVIFRDHTIRIFDPLEDDPELLAKASRVGKKAGLVSTAWKPVPEEHRVLNPDEMQTLVDELQRMLTNEYVKLVSGKMPSVEEMRQRQGRILYSPATRNAYKPKYQDEAHEWLMEINRRPR